VGQGFFFFTDNAGTLEFNNSQRAFIPEGTGGSFFFKSNKKIKGKTTLPVLKLGMDFSPEKNQIFHKQIAISFKKGNSFKYDRGFDSKIQERQGTDMYWKFPEQEDFYGIAGIQNITEDLEVPLEIIIENDQKISIGVDELQNVNKTVFLKDAQTNTFYNITNTKVSLQLESGTFSERFYLVFKESSVLNVNDDELFLDDVFINHNRKTKKLTITNNGKRSIKKVTMYSLLGQKVLEATNKFQLSKKEIVIKTNGLKQTVYVLLIETPEGKITKKFI
jgi:hypothetical protein